MSSYIGDIRLGDTIDIKFCTVNTSGVPTQLAGSPVVSAYPGNSTTQLTAGITLTVDFDTVTGLNNVRVVASSGNGYATATNYTLVITTGTVGGSSVVGYVVGEFSIEARSAVIPTVAARTLDISATGEAGIDWANIGSPTTAVNLSGTNIDVDQVVASVSGAVGSVTGNVGGNVAGSVGSVTAAVSANVTQISGDTAAADNAEAFFDGTGYAGTNNVIPTVTTVNGLAAGVITAAAIATNAIDADAIAADAIAEIQAGLATPTNITAGTITTVTNLTNLPTIPANWLTAAGLAADAVTEIQGGLSTLDATGVRSAVGLASANLDTQLATIEAQTNDIGTAGAGLTALPWNAAWDAEVQSEVADALAAYDPPTNTEMEARTLTAASYATAANQTTILARLGSFTGSGVNTILGFFQALLRSDATTPSDVGGTYDDATDSLQAIRDRGDAAWGAGAVPSVADIADGVWDEILSGHTSAGSTGEALNAAGGAGDPWITTLPGSYTSGQAGYIVGTNLDTTIGSRATQTSVDTIDNLVDDLETRIGTPSNLGSGATVAANLVDIEGQTDDIGAAGAGLTALGDTRLANLDATISSRATPAQVNTEMDTALADVNLDHLVGTATAIPAVPAGTYIDQMMDNGTATYDRTTDSLQAIRDRGDAAWTTATLTAQNVWEYATRTLTAFGFSVTVGTNSDKTGYSLSAAEVQAIWDALTSALTTVGSIGRLLVDNVNATISSRSSHSAADVWAVATRILTAGTNITLAKGTGITGFNDLSAAQVNAEVDTALTDYDPPTSAELVSEINSVQVDIAALNNLSAAQVNAEVVDVLRVDLIPDSYAADGSQPTMAQALLTVLQFLTEKSVAGTTVTVNKPDGTTAAITLTINDATTPTSITRSA